MSIERYPQKLAISLQDFRESGWKEAINQEAIVSYKGMWQSLYYAAFSAIENGRLEHGKVLWLLADACSMMLSPSGSNEPFKSRFVGTDRQAVTPDDFLDSDIAFFAEIVDVVDDSWLKARLSDLVWLRQRKPKFALEAIDAYRKLPLDEDTWIHEGQECWLRAIVLCKQLRKGAGDRLQKIETTIIAAFKTAKRENNYLGFWLAEVLYSIGLEENNQLEVASKLEALAKEFDSSGDFFKAREYFLAAHDWYKDMRNQDKKAEMIVEAAECWVKEAIARSTSVNPSYMEAPQFYTNAIRELQDVEHSVRAKYKVDERIAELRVDLNISGKRAVEEIGFVQIPDLDVLQFAEDARRSVSGKSVHDALLMFANLHSEINAEQLRSNVLERMHQFQFQASLATSTFSNDGRIIVKNSAMKSGTELMEIDENTIRAQMIKEYGLLVNIVVAGKIWPALDVLLLEHRLKERDFISLAKRSSFVPKDRAGLFGKALFAGYERDFVTALHLLIPQLEHLVREHLKQEKAKTSSIRDDIQTENGMSTLIKLPEAEQIFGKNLAFEFNALFCDASGPNLRNELAHGLLSEEECKSAHSIYAWWLALRLTINTWWNSMHSQGSSSEPSGNEEL